MEEPKESFPSQKRKVTELQDLFDQIHAEQLLIEPVEKYQEEKDQKVNKPSSFYGNIAEGFMAFAKRKGILDKMKNCRHGLTALSLSYSCGM